MIFKQTNMNNGNVNNVWETAHGPEKQFSVRSARLDKHFYDWHCDVFGFGYGTGEQHILPALRRFFELIKDSQHGGNPSYDFRELEANLSPVVAWLLINVMCGEDIVEYGTSPRFAWLTNKGIRLREYMLSKDLDNLYAVSTGPEHWDVPCYPDHCNCGLCEADPNPFWKD